MDRLQKALSLLFVLVIFFLLMLQLQEQVFTVFVIGVNGQSLLETQYGVVDQILRRI